MNTLQLEVDERKLNEELLQQQFKQQKDTAEKSSAMLESVEQERAKIAGELQTAREECMVANAEHTKLKCSSDSFVSELKDHVKALEADKSTMQCQLVEVGVKLEMKDGDIQRLIDAKLELTRKNEQLLQEQRQLVDSGQRLQVDIDQLSRCCEEASAQVVVLTTQLEEASRDWAGKLERADDALAAVQEKLRISDIENDSLKMELSVTGSEVEKRDGDRRVAEARVVDLVATSEMLHQQIAAEKEAKEKLSSEVLGLGSERDTMAGRLEECERELADVKEKQVETSGKSEALVASLKEQLTAAEDKKASLQQEIEQAALKLDCNEETATATARQLSQCKEHNEQLFQQIQGSKDAVEQLQSVLSTVEEEKGKIAVELDATKDELRTVKSAKEKLQCESTGLIEHLQKTRKEEEDKRVGLQVELQDAMTKLDTREESMVSTVHELSQCREDNEQLLQQIQGSKDSVEHLKSMLSTLEEEKRKVVAELDAAKYELNAVTTANEKLQCESTGLIEDLQKRQKETEDEKVALKMELEEAMAKLDSNEESAASIVQELSQYKEHNEQLLQQNGESKNAVEQLELKVALSEENNEKIAVELEAVKDELVTRGREQETQQHQSAGVIEDLRQQCKAAEERAAALEKELQEALLKMDNGQEVMSGVVQQLEQAREREAVLLQQLEQFNQRLVAMETVIVELETEKAALVTRCEELLVELEAGRTDEAESRLKQEALIVELQQQVSVVNGERDTAKNDVDAAAFKMENLTEDVESLSEQLTESTAHQTQLEQCCSELKASMVDVERRLVESEEEKCVALAVVEELQEQIESLKAERAAKKAEEENVDTHVQQLESDTKRQHELLLAANDELNKLQVALTAEETRCSGLQQEKCDLVNDLDAAKRQVGHLEGEKADLLGSTQTLEGVVAASQTAIDGLRQEAITAEETKVALTANLVDQAHSAEKALADSRQHCEELQLKLDVADIERAETEASYAQKETDSESRVEQLRADIASCQIENRSLLARLKDTEFLLATAQQERTSLQAETEQKQADTAALLETHAAEITHRDNLEAGLQADLSGMRVELGRLEGDLARSQERTGELEQQVLTMQEEISCSTAVQRRTESEHSRECSALQKCVVELEAAVTEKSRQVETLESNAQIAKTSADCCESELQVALQTQVGKTRELESQLREVEMLHASKMDSLVSEHTFKMAAQHEEMDALQQDVEKLRGELHASSDHLQSLSTEYTSELAMTKHELDQTVTTSQTVNEELGRMRDQLEDAREALGKKETELKAAVDDLVDLKAELNAKAEELKQGQFVAETRVREMEATCGKLEAQLRVAYDCGEDTEQLLREKTNEIVVLNQHVGSLKASIFEADAKKKEIEEQYQMLTAEKDRIVAENEKHRDDHQEAMSELERQLCEAKEQVDDSGVQLGMLHDSVAAIERVLSSERERHSREQADWALKIQQVENEVKGKQTEVDSVQSELDVALAAVDEQVVTAQSKSADLSCALHEMERTSLEQRHQLETQLAGLRTQLEFAADTAESEKTVLQNELSTVRDQLHETKDMIHTSDVARSQKVAELEAEVSRLTVAVDQLERQAMTSEELLSTAKLEVAARTEELFAARERIKSLTEESKQVGSVSQQEQDCARENLRQMETSLTDTEEKLASANEEKFAFEQKLSEALRVQAQLQQQIISLEGSTEQATVEKDIQLALIENLRQQIEDERTRKESETSHLNVLIQELQFKVSQVGEVETERGERCSEMENILAVTEAKLAATKDRIVEMETRLSEAGTAEAQLWHQVSSLEANKEQMRMEGEEREAALGDVTERYDRSTEQYNCDVANLRQAVATLEKRLQEKQESSVELEQELVLQKAACALLEAREEQGTREQERENEVLREKLLDAERQLDGRREHVQELETMLQDMETSSAEVKRELEVECSRLREQLRTLEAVEPTTVSYSASLQSDVEERCNALLSENETVRGERNNLVSKVAHLRNDMIQLQDQMNTDTVRYNEDISERVAEVATLKEKLICLEGEREATAAEIVHLQNKNLCLDGSIKASASEVSMLTENIHSLEDDKKAAINEVAVLNEKMRTLEGNTETITTAVAALKETIIQLETDEESARTEIAILEERTRQLQNQLTVVEEKNVSTLADCKDKTEELQQMKDERRQLEQEVEQLNVSLDIARSECSQELQTRIDMLGAENVELIKDLTDVKKSETDVKTALTLAQAENLNVVAKLQTAESDMLALTEMHDVVSAENKELREKFRNAGQQISDLSMKVDVAEAKAKELSEKVDGLQMEKDDLAEGLQRVENEKSVATENLNNANVEISALRSEVDSTRTDAETMHDENIRLHNQVEGKHMESGALTEQLQEMQEQLEELSEQKSQLHEQLGELQSHVSEVSEERDAVVSRCAAIEAEHCMLQETLTQVDAEHQELQCMVEQLRSTVERLEREKRETETKAEETEELLQVIQVESEGLQEDVEESRRTSCDLQARLEALQTDRDAAITVAADHQEALNRQEVEVAALRKELRDMEVDWESKSREMEELGRTVGRLEWEAKDAEKQTRRLEERCSATRTAHDDCLAELDTVRHQYSSVMDHVHELEAAAASHTDSVEALTVELTATLADNDRLQQELKQLTVDAITAQAEVTQQLADARRDLETRHQEGVSLQQQLSEQRLQKVEVDKQTAQLGDQMEQLAFERAELQVENEALVSRTATLETTLAQKTEELNEATVSLAEKQEELEQLRSKVQLLEQVQEELEQLQNKVKLLENDQEELGVLRSKVKLLELAQEETAILKKELIEASSEQLRLKEKSETHKVSACLLQNLTCILVDQIIISLI